MTFIDFQDTLIYCVWFKIVSFSMYFALTFCLNIFKWRFIFYCNMTSSMSWYFYGFLSFSALNCLMWVFLMSSKRRGVVCTTLTLAGVQDFKGKGYAASVLAGRSSPNIILDHGESNIKLHFHYSAGSWLPNSPM